MHSILINAIFTLRLDKIMEAMMLELLILTFVCCERREYANTYDKNNNTRTCLETHH